MGAKSSIRDLQLQAPYQSSASSRDSEKYRRVKTKTTLKVFGEFTN
jgi:hypothetical protein